MGIYFFKKLQPPSNVLYCLEQVTVCGLPQGAPVNIYRWNLMNEDTNPLGLLLGFMKSY